MSVVEIPNSVISNHPITGGAPLSWKSQAEKISEDILLIRNAIPKIDDLEPAAEAHADLFNQSTVVDENLTSRPDDRYRRSAEIELAGANCPDELIAYGLFCKTSEARYLMAYREMVNQHAVVAVSSGYSLVRYREGDYFREHVDATRDHPVLGHRRLSVVLFGNDGFEGGLLRFPRQDLTIEPEKGTMVIFPSCYTHPHESTEITKGTKYSIVSWYY